MFDVIHNAVAGVLDIAYIIDASILFAGCSIAIYFLWGIRKPAE